jgi:hypothetical protein
MFGRRRQEIRRSKPLRKTRTRTVIGGSSKVCDLVEFADSIVNVSTLASDHGVNVVQFTVADFFMAYTHGPKLWCMNVRLNVGFYTWYQMIYTYTNIHVYLHTNIYRDV